LSVFDWLKQIHPMFLSVQAFIDKELDRDENKQACFFLGLTREDVPNHFSDFPSLIQLILQKIHNILLLAEK
jgi:hypothetical protein